MVGSAASLLKTCLARRLRRIGARLPRGPAKTRRRRRRGRSHSCSRGPRAWHGQRPRRRPRATALRRGTQHRGVDRAPAGRVGANPIVGKVERHRPGELVEPSTKGRAGGNVRLASRALHGRDVDDRPAAASAHLGDSVATGETAAFEVDGEHLALDRLLGVLGRAVALDACAVGQELDASEAPSRLAHQGRHVRDAVWALPASFEQKTTGLRHARQTSRWLVRCRSILGVTTATLSRNSARSATLHRLPGLWGGYGLRPSGRISSLCLSAVWSTGTPVFQRGIGCLPGS